MPGSILLYDNRFLDGAPTAGSTDAGAEFDPLNVRDLRTYTHWRASSSAPDALTVDCGSPKGADTLVIVRHNLGTVSSQVSVESSDDGSAWTSRQSAFVPVSDKLIVKRWVTAQARYWRISFNAQAAPVQLAVAMIGMAIEFPRYPDAPFAIRSVKQEMDQITSKTGQLIGAVSRFKTEDVSATWTTVRADFVDGELWPFYRDHASIGNPFLWSWNPQDRPEDAMFVRLKQGFTFSPTKTLLAYYDRVSLDMEGVLE
jgi:hypothetical protein